jgi:hypothetical protein
MTMNRNCYYAALVPLTAALCLAGGVAKAQSISVDVNNQPIVFTGASPVQTKGAVLVPLRGVFEALGATVNYDPAAKTIAAQKGDTTVILTIGAMSATVNGQTQPLSQAAEVVQGTTLVPLRFIAQALGAYVNWVPSTLTVQIQTPEAHLSTLPPPPVSKGADSSQNLVVGQLTGIYTDAVPEQITVRVNGQNTAVPIAASSTVVVRRNDQPVSSSDIHQLAVGDQVRVHVGADGNATTIEAVFGEVVGTLKAIQRQADGTFMVNLNDGTSVQMSQDADFRMAGRHIVASDIMPSERVRIRTDQSNKIGYSLDVVTDDQTSTNVNEPPQASQTSSNDAPLNGGQDGAAAADISGHAISASDESPSNGSSAPTSRPVIYALLSEDNLLAANQPSIHLLVDNNDVTKLATATDQFVTFQPTAPLVPGTHTVDIRYVDSTGVHTLKAWSFNVSQQAQSLVFTSNRTGREIALKPGEYVDFRLTAQSGGTAFVTIADVKLPLAETSPGVYTGRLNAALGKGIVNAPVTAHYSTPNHTCLTADLKQMISVNAAAPMCPQIKSPTNGQQIGSNIQITGVSAPGSVVNITVNYAARALGMIGITGTAASTQAVADTDGKWTTDKLAVATPALLSSSRNTGLTITAVAVDASGQRSAAASVKVLLQ